MPGLGEHALDHGRRLIPMPVHTSLGNWMRTSEPSAQPSSLSARRREARKSHPLQTESLTR
jgi:hypothetical protein